MNEKTLQKILKKIDIIIALTVLKATEKSRREIEKHQNYIKKIEEITQLKEN